MSSEDKASTDLDEQFGVDGTGVIEIQIIRKGQVDLFWAMEAIERVLGYSFSTYNQNMMFCQMATHLS
jgi:hypothetical protein